MGRLAGRLVAVSEAAKETHITELGISRERFVVLPNVPVSAYLLADDFDPAQKRRELGMSPLQMPASQLLLGGMGTGGRTF